MSCKSALNRMNYIFSLSEDNKKDKKSKKKCAPIIWGAFYPKYGKMHPKL